ncbi:MAG: hypothetical protein WCB99_11635 [Candidatus Cybelea sp.]|jgi:hypothetical protein
MKSLGRIIIVAILGIWMVGSLAPQVACVWNSSCPSNGLSVDDDGVVTGVDDGSPAARATIVATDRVEAPLPNGLFREPSKPFSFKIIHSGVRRQIMLAPVPTALPWTERLTLLALCISYVIFLLVGSAVLLLRPSAMTWSFYLFCVLRRYGDVGFYWPGSDWFFWANVLALVTLGGASCALVTIFALRFPNDRIDEWRRPINRIALLLAILFPFAWLYVFIRLNFLGSPSEGIIDLLVRLTSVVYLGAAAIFIVTLIQSRGDERQRLKWILVFPAVLILRVLAINLPFALPTWFDDLLIILAVFIPLSVAYAIIRQRVFDIQFAISRALVYAAITTVVAGTFFLLDWFMSKQFSETRFTLTAEIILAIAIGSSLNMLHRNVDRFVDSTFFRQRHIAEKRLAKAAAAVLRAESTEVVDRFLVHEPGLALDLTSAALFRRAASKHFVREVAIGWDRAHRQELTADDPLVLHLLAEGGPVRLADVTWPGAESPVHVGDAVLATPVLLRDELVAIALYGPHHSGADIDPDEVRSIEQLVVHAGAAYDHIEARALRAQVEALVRERDAKQREIETLRASTA